MSSWRFRLAAGAFLGSAVVCGTACGAVSESSTDAATSIELRSALDAIGSDFGRLQDEVTATNLAADPAVRAAAISKANGTLARLSDECRQAERIYSQLQGTLPPKVGASSARATADLNEIVGDLSAAEQNLTEMQTLVASLQ